MRATFCVTFFGRGRIKKSCTQAPVNTAAEGEKSSKEVIVEQQAAVKVKENAVAAEKLQTARTEFEGLVPEVKSLGASEQDVEKTYKP